MAETCRPNSSRDGGMPKESFAKFSMKRLELSIKKFIKVLTIDLDRLQKHTLNISRLTKFEDWSGLHKEQVNATRTVQQINANIMEIEKARRQVTDEDLKEFDERVNPVKTQAVEAIGELMAFIGQGPRPSSQVNSDNSGFVETGTGDVDLNSILMQRSGADRIPASESMTTSNHDIEKQETAISTKGSVSERKNSKSKTGSYAQWKALSVPSSDMPHLDYVDGSPIPLLSESQPQVEPAPLLTATLHVVPENSQASASWEQLQESILDLNELVHDFANRVEEQGENIDVIENHIEEAQGGVEEGTSHLAKASKYKSVIFPVVGAVVGGAVGGPIGFLAGMKIGGMAGVIGGAVGLAGGTIYKKRQDKITDMEMSNMSAKRSQSMPEVLNHACEEDTTPSSSEINDRSKSQSLGRMDDSRGLSIFSSDEQ